MVWQGNSSAGSLWPLMWLLRQDTKICGPLSSCGFLSFTCLAQPSYAATGSQKGAFQEDEHQYSSAYLASACIILANVPLSKASHMAKPRVNVGGDHIQGFEYRMWGSLGATARSSGILVSKPTERVRQGYIYIVDGLWVWTGVERGQVKNVLFDELCPLVEPRGHLRRLYFLIISISLCFFWYEQLASSQSYLRYCVNTASIQVPKLNPQLDRCL